MNHVNVTLAQRDMSMLAPLIGGRWVFMAGEAMTPHMFSPVDVIVNTTNAAVRIVSETFDSNFEGGEDDTYARLWISDDVSGLRVARREGNVYVHHRDELIDDVLVVRDTVSAIESGETLWTLTTDVATVQSPRCGTPASSWRRTISRYGRQRGVHVSQNRGCALGSHCQRPTGFWEDHDCSRACGGAAAPGVLHEPS